MYPDLNGCWEEGYHYYLELSDDSLRLRRYDRAIVLETAVTYQWKNKERCEILPQDRILSYSVDHRMMSEIRSLTYEKGEIRLLYYSLINGETEYILHKTDRSPFSHIIIRDEEYLDSLQGKWKRYKGDDFLKIKGNTLSWMGMEEKFCVVSYAYDPDKVYIHPADLSRDNFPAFTQIEVRKDMLTCTVIVMDASMPLTVFAREDMMNRRTIPEAADRGMKNTMLKKEPDTGHRALETIPEGYQYCPECGYKCEESLKFCPECGTKLK